MGTTIDPLDQLLNVSTTKDVLNHLVGGVFRGVWPLRHLNLLIDKMNQKSSSIQILKSVQRVLTSDRQDDIVQNADFEIWRYKGVNPDDPSSVGTPTKADWTPGTTATKFEIDAKSNEILVKNGREVRGDPRVYKPVPNPTNTVE